MRTWPGMPAAAAATLLTAALLLVAPLGSAAPSASVFRVTGAEIAASSTRGTFVGSASAGGTRGSWRAVVQHAALGPRPSAITGGSIQLATLGPGLSPELVRASFAGGSVSVVDSGSGCARQTFAVHGDLGGVSTRTSRGGSGVLDATLTHYRARLLGRCITYAASVTGSASFSY